MSLKKSVTIGIAVIIVALIGIVSFVVWQGQNQLLEYMVEDEINSTRHVAQEILDQQTEKALAIAVSLSTHPSTMELAAEEDRDRALEELVPVFESLEEEIGLGVMHLRAPYNTSLLRAHAIENYGDTTDREIILRTAEEGEYFTGFIEGAYSVGMRGWAPVFYEGEVVGTLETNLDFTEEMMGELAEVLHSDLGMFMVEDDEYEATVFTGEHANDELVDLINPESFEEAETGEASSINYLDDNTAYSLFPLEDPEGNIIAVMGVFEDISEMNSMVMSSTTRTLGIMALLGLVIIVVVIYVSNRIVIKPVEEISKASEKIANKDLTGEDLPDNRSDEIGMLAKSFNDMKHNLSGIIKTNQENASEVESYSSEMSESTSKLEDSSGQVESAMQQVTEGAENQATELGEAAENMENLTQKIELVSKRVKEMSEASQGVIDNVNKGSGSIQSSVDSIQSIKEKVIKSSETVGSLGDKSRQINEIVDMIRNISEQTHLLSLNAAIEAARSGEEGKGFSVVAEEVRKLAEESSNATERIAGLISDVQGQINEAITSINESTEEAEKGTNTIEESGKNFEEIKNEIDSLLEYIQEVSSNAEDMAVSGREVERVIQDVSAAGEEFTSSAEEVSASVEEQNRAIKNIAESAVKLKELSNKLNAYAREFRIK
ncbi:methyl-accepting chemotaxis protein [Natranaerofaba carboxydovora]|uniref:methyl-accepting chemotaxis protein n=1 Tax=Natranaerofaba carboxydovora TaxID=2742683 RepID=UPI001F13E1FC|nr:methyl-accepting chemotaxis protein [Natranaerofaba carboxydovora]UMZ74207.1 Putative methyl-accepting chemotaxis protein YoaH [Natranaerofaba carboxydovora]